jgi:hypothetical protein
MQEVPEREPNEKEERATTGPGFVLILLIAVAAGALGDWLFHLLYHNPARRTGAVGPLCALGTFAYLFSAERTKRIRRLFADKL